ncbi:ATP-dependent helicase HrpB [Pseudoroseicyclus tamaricis]|uniref:ATP-dependent helicase HrpB n=1 Tax=Pseudoroseicyclus tamaricis TaxID=2705421 RepID=UPI001F3A1E5F|nr:ATP-dependent helicase HrpB [Pseudoroseicyclus tamaricis]
MSLPRLPIDDALPALLTALQETGHAVLQAPPGAGKTTRVPPAMLAAGLAGPGRILMLEPRRLAARAAAERMATERGERPGETIGYRMRGEAVTSPATRIEVITEGILTRMIQSDPELPGISAILFDEFHERSLQADLGLALALEIRGALRPDLRLVVMSATLDAAPVAALMGDAPVITSEGRTYPVERLWLDKPPPPRARLEQEVAALTLQALSETEGGVLVFLPGEGEIRRTEAALSGRLPAGAQCFPLYGALPPAAQRAALAPFDGRKVVLSTAIAETSLTIDGIRVVVDAGRARRALFDPGSGMSRLVTERVTRAEAEQRAGRAGRVAPGRAYRLWTKGEEGALAAQPRPEIEAGDLAPLALDLALWGSADLPFLTPPPEAALAEARALLLGLGALDASGLITAHGRRLAALPLHPRLAHMLAEAGAPAAPLAALLSERDPFGPSAGVDVAPRLSALAGQPGPSAPPPALKRLRSETKRLARGLPETHASPGIAAALAFPDRIALRRPGDAPRYLLSGGKGAILPEADPLAGDRLLVAIETDGHPREARIRLAARLTEAELRETFGARITWVQLCEWSRRERRVVAREEERLGALTLASRRWEAPGELRARAMLEGVRLTGLSLSGAALRLSQRVELARSAGADVPPFTEEALLAEAEEWLLPYIGSVSSEAEWRGFNLVPPLTARLGWAGEQAVSSAIPSHFTTPLGNRVPISYEDGQPAIELRMQEMFGTTRHPVAAGQPIRITLLSPARRPLQVTMDLPGFWAGEYAEVRKEMRGRYPRHPWPEDPRVADPTLRAKPRGT